MAVNITYVFWILKEIGKGTLNTLKYKYNQKLVY